MVLRRLARGLPMEIKIRKWTDSGGVQHLSVGLPEADDNLEMVRGGISPHTWVNYSHDLKHFLAGMEKPLAEARPSDIFAFLRRPLDPRSFQSTGKPSS